MKRLLFAPALLPLLLLLHAPDAPAAAAAASDASCCEVCPEGICEECPPECCLPENCPLAAAVEAFHEHLTQQVEECCPVSCPCPSNGTGE